VRDCFFAVALGFGGHAATTHKDQIGDRPRKLGDRPQINDFVTSGTVSGFEVKRLGTVEAAAKCDKGDFHL
jgi:hypothetical protein